MQPRKALWPLRGDTVFQVTKSGCTSGRGKTGEGCFERLKEKNEEFDDDLELPPSAALDDVVEVDEEEEEPDAGERAWRRAMLGS